MCFDQNLNSLVHMAVWETFLETIIILAHTAEIAYSSFKMCQSRRYA